MAVICPTITAYNAAEYREQMYNVSSFARRIHIDLMDGKFAPTTSVSLDEVWWPKHIQVDLHVMFQQPMEHLEQLIKLQPRMVIVHAEAEVHHMHFVAELHKAEIEAGLAILQDTPVENIEQISHSFDEILIFSGNLGHHGGHADLGLLSRVKYLRDNHFDGKIAWDGGIGSDNIRSLVQGGVEVLNVGGAIQKASDPQTAYDTLIRSMNV